MWVWSCHGGTLCVGVVMSWWYTLWVWPCHDGPLTCQKCIHHSQTGGRTWASGCTFLEVESETKHCLNLDHLLIHCKLQNLKVAQTYQVFQHRVYCGLCAGQPHDLTHFPVSRPGRATSHQYNSITRSMLDRPQTEQLPHHCDGVGAGALQDVACLLKLNRGIILRAYCHGNRLFPPAPAGVLDTHCRKTEKNEEGKKKKEM